MSETKQTIIEVVWADDSKSDIKITLNTKTTYINLVKGIANLSVKSENDIQVLKQWHLTGRNLSKLGVDACHCKTKIVDNIEIRNIFTKLRTVVGNVCQGYFRDDDMNQSFKDRKYERLNNCERKKCNFCNKNLNKNNMSGVCYKCKVRKTRAIRVCKKEVKSKVRKYNDTVIERERISNYKMKFGKYKNQPLKNCSYSYLRWLLAQSWFRDYNNNISNYLNLP